MITEHQAKKNKVAANIMGFIDAYDHFLQKKRTYSQAEISDILKERVVDCCKRSKL